MPLYEYQCTSCGDLQTISLPIDRRKEPTERPCAVCSSIDTISIKINAPTIGYSHGLKTTDSFNDKLKEMKSKLPKSAHQSLENHIK